MLTLKVFVDMCWVSLMVMWCLAELRILVLFKKHEIRQIRHGKWHNEYEIIALWLQYWLAELQIRSILLHTIPSLVTYNQFRFQIWIMFHTILFLFVVEYLACLKNHRKWIRFWRAAKTAEMGLFQRGSRVSPETLGDHGGRWVGVGKWDRNEGLQQTKRQAPANWSLWDGMV